MGKLTLQIEGSTPAAPSTDLIQVYALSDGNLYTQDENSIETQITANTQNITDLSLAPDTTLQIATGAVTQTQTYHLIQSETGTTDDLDTITASEGEAFILIQALATHTITVKHGTGNIQLRGNADITLTETDALLLLWDGTQWMDLGAGGGAGASQLTDLSDVSTAAQTANFIMAAGDGSTGGDYRGRALVAADIPSLAASILTSGQVALAQGGAGIDLSTIAKGSIIGADAANSLGIIDASAASDGDVPTIQADGSIAFETPVGGGGANTALSNLASVAVNDHIIPDSANDTDLGASGFNWRHVYMRRLAFTPSASTITIASGVADLSTLAASAGLVNLAAETGVTDSITSFSNIPYSGLYYLQADTGDTITLVHDGTNIVLPNEGSLQLQAGVKVLALLIVGSSCTVLGAAHEFDTGKFAVVDGTDNSKKIAIDASGLTTATTRTVTMPDSDETIGVDDTAIHDDASGEISALTEKASPVSGDLLIIEDSAASNVKKKVQIGNLPGGGTAAIAVGTYTGDSNATQAITGVGFQPDAMMIYLHLGGLVGTPMFSSSGMSGNTSYFDGIARYATDHIVSLDSDGFTVGDGTGTTNYLNVGSRVYSYVCWKA